MLGIAGIGQAMNGDGKLLIARHPATDDLRLNKANRLVEVQSGFVSLQDLNAEAFRALRKD